MLVCADRTDSIQQEAVTKPLSTGERHVIIRQSLACMDDPGLEPLCPLEVMELINTSFLSPGRHVHILELFAAEVGSQCCMRGPQMALQLVFTGHNFSHVADIAS